MVWVGCAAGSCASNNSARYRNEEVTVDQMVSTGEGSSDRGWSGADLVFFFGHNTQIQPQIDSTFKYWVKVDHVPKENGAGYYSGWDQRLIGDWQDWGTSQAPYAYHYETVDNASLSNAYAVFYAYNPITSVLIGKDFPRSGGTWLTEDYKGTTSPPRVNTNKLGPETEWVIAHGCNAVTVATIDGSAPLALGVNAWRKSWNGLHLVLGHYNGITTDTEPDLNEFAIALKAGDLVRDAYFDVHKDCYSGMGHQAVIESVRPSCCNFSHELGEWVCPASGCVGDYLSTDRWQPNHMQDIVANELAFVVEWVVNE
jgi:hypothetical protein